MAICLFYTLLSLANMAFSLYLVFGTVIDAESEALSKKSEALSEDSSIGGIGVLSFGEETYLAKQVYEVLVPGTFLIPYLVWTFTGYPLRRWLRGFNNFIPFSDDVRSARVIELAVAEKFMEPPMIYISWDYSAHLILPLWSCGLCFLACPQYHYRIFLALATWSQEFYSSLILPPPHHG